MYVYGTVVEKKTDYAAKNILVTFQHRKYRKCQNSIEKYDGVKCCYK